MHIKSSSIKNKDDIEKIKRYFVSSGIKSSRVFEWDKQLLYFILGINTCYKTDELLNIKWSDIFDFRNASVYDYISYEKYKFYLNSNCKNALYDFIEKYNRQEKDIYIFTSRSKGNKPITSEAVNRIYRTIQNELELQFNFSMMSLRKTFAYWQIYYCNRDYIKMSKLKELLHTMTIGNDINIFADYHIKNDYTYINDVNL